MYMKTSIINFKTDSQLKRQAQHKAEELGLTLSTVLNAYLRKFLHTKDIEFIEEREPSPYLKKVIAQTEEEIKQGDVIRFTSYAEEEAWLDKLITDARKRRKKAA